MTAAKPTDWSGYDLHQIWAMLKDEGGEASYDQIRAWFRIEYICRHHADQLTAALTTLAASWPAAKGNAAERFQEYVRTLVAHLRATSSAADANGRALATYHEVLVETRRNVARLVDGLPAPTSGLAGSTAAHARIQKLTAEARAAMSTADQSAQILARLVARPQSYIAGGLVDKSTDPDPERPAPRHDGALPSGGGGPLDVPDSAAHNASDAGATAGREPQAPVLAGGSGPVSRYGPAQPDYGEQGLDSPVAGHGGSESNPLGRVIGGGSEGPRTGAGGSPSAGGVPRPGSSAPAHGSGASGLIGAPMMAGGASTTRDGTRVARAGAVIGGDRGRRQRPHDPDDPWAVEVEVVEPVIGPQGSDHKGPDGDLPPGVVSIEGWPR